ncbi:Vacuolar protein sorting-associated protein 33a [Lasiodiplodia theobromae]|uniref:Vacuolar protein sorting-associated protein 33a n=1 Tax=Lasiodiplodia theobromae TaxID=45133 RepID=UPI0015C3C647|nr:Vacuolar protein sorting-associated protein 33a [Lasiodiplodia theobromae]KAF4538470.1 Vacuolar protein sorting-associated protein 33a [Lasiodiplodia theobromae]
MAPQAAIHAADIADAARRSLLLLLEGIRGKKNLVFEKALSGPLNLLLKFSTLQEYGVDKPFFLENGNVDSSQRNVVFIARGDKAKTALAIAEQIKKLRHNDMVEHEFSVFWVPRRTLVSDQILEEAGVLGEVSVAEWPLNFVPLSDDLLSLELEDSITDLYVRKDPTPTFLAARALMQLQQQHGLFPRIVGKGDNARRLADLLIRMRTEVVAGSGSTTDSPLGLTPSNVLDSLIIIDREVDFPTALLTQLTYEGLLDEEFHIQSNQIEVDSSVVGTAGAGTSQGGASSSAAPLRRKIALEPSDTLYGTLRDSNFATVGPLLNKVARRLQSSYENRNIQQKSTAELRDFVQKLPGFQQEQASLKLHTNLAEEIIKHTRSDIFSRILEVQQNLAAGADPSSQHDNIEELIARGVKIETILRLLCLESSLHGGIRPRDLENFKRAVLHGYGHQHLLTLTSLEKAGLLVPRSGGLGVGANLGGVGGVAARANAVTNYNSVRRSLSLIVDEVNESEPDDVAYVFSGYAPLSVRLVQCVLQKDYINALASARPAAAGANAAQAANQQQQHLSGALANAQGWRPFEDTLRYIRGATVDEVQAGEEKAVRARQLLNGSGGNAGEGKTVVVFFLGGVTRAEASALRFVAKCLAEEGRGRRLVVATTSVITGDKVVGSAVEKGSLGGPA